MKRKLNKGVTLPEIMTVVAILSMLSAVAVPGYRHIRKETKKKQVISNLRAIAEARTSYCALNNNISCDDISFEQLYPELLKAGGSNGNPLSSSDGFEYVWGGPEGVRWKGQYNLAMMLDPASGEAAMVAQGY
jgi:prepilin-type N-terminal cleavage/methylation domain-containing protein